VSTPRDACVLCASLRARHRAVRDFRQYDVSPCRRRSDGLCFRPDVSRRQGRRQGPHYRRIDQERPRPSYYRCCRRRSSRRSRREPEASPDLLAGLRRVRRGERGRQDEHGQGLMRRWRRSTASSPETSFACAATRPLWACPGAVAVVAPFASSTGGALVGGICLRCEGLGPEHVQRACLAGFKRDGLQDVAEVQAGAA
jgi:hypothetical protein